MPYPLAAAAAKSLQSCPTLCDPIDSSPPGSPIPGILQARTVEWVAISCSNAWKWKLKVKSFSCVRLFATPWTAAYQALPSMGFSRQEYWSGVPLPSLPDRMRDTQNPRPGVGAAVSYRHSLSLVYTIHAWQRRGNLNAERTHDFSSQSHTTATECLEINSIQLQMSLSRILPLSHILETGWVFWRHFN